MSQKRKNVNNDVPVKKRRVLTFQEKKDLCFLRQENPLMTQEEIGLKFGIKKNTVCDILKDKEKWLNIELTGSNTAKQRQLSAKFPELEEALAIWMSKALVANKTITGEIIIAKAINFANLLNIKGFTGSSSWLSNFKKRYNIKQYNKHGEAQSGPSEEELDKEREKLQELISNYDIENVFNCDETGNNFIELINVIYFILTKVLFNLGLYWELEPSKTLSTGPLSGTKKSKNRVTILLTFNATGSMKLPALFIHKYKTPRDLTGIDKSKLPVDYFWNKSAWMQKSIWNKYLELLNKKMKRLDKKILLLVDNATVHAVDNPELLTNITIHYLPPNTTAHLQPADAGIINSFKVCILFINKL